MGKHRKHKTRNKGIFIVVDGFDNIGKSSCIKEFVKQYPIQSRYSEIPIWSTAEPYTEVSSGKLIRQFLSQKNTEFVNDELFSKLYAVNRLQHCYSKNGILDRLKANEIVITDRWLTTSLVYNGTTAYEDNRTILDDRRLQPDILVLCISNRASWNYNMNIRKQAKEYYELKLQDFYRTQDEWEKTMKSYHHLLKTFYREDVPFITFDLAIDPRYWGDKEKYKQQCDIMHQCFAERIIGHIDRILYDRTQTTPV